VRRRLGKYGRMRSTEAEASVVAYLSAAPGPRDERPGAAPGGWVGHVQHGGGAGAVPSTIRFRRDRAFQGCHMYAVSFRTGDGPPWLMVVRAFQRPDGAWEADPIGGGAGRGPARSWPWVNFTARGGRTGGDFAGGGEVIGEGSDLARKVLVRFADGTTAEDEVQDGLVLVYIDHPVVCPAQVAVLDMDGRALSDYSAFEQLA
jgi:hypothetical protein